MRGLRGNAGGSPFGQRLFKLFKSREGIVLALAILAFLSFSFLAPAFASAGHLLALIRIVSILGMPALGAALAVSARGVDISMIAKMAVSGSSAFGLSRPGYSFGIALFIAGGFAPLVGKSTGAIAGIRQIIGSLADAGAGVVVISPYGAKILNLSDRIPVARQGRIVEEMTIDEPAGKKVAHAAVR